MFATLLGALPRPPLGDDVAPEALLDAVLECQALHGLEPLTDAGSTRSENLKRSRWFSAISDTAQPVCVHPRSQLMMQKAWPPRHLMRTDDASSPEPLEQPVSASMPVSRAPAAAERGRNENEDALRMGSELRGGRSGLRTAGVHTR